MKNKTKRKEDILKDARDLSNYTVHDLQSSLGCNKYSLSVLSWAEHFSRCRGEKTKASILRRAIKKMEKNSENSK